MGISGLLGLHLAVALVLGGCSGDPDRDRPLDRPSPTQASAETSPPRGGDLSSFSGRIAFDNFEDVWTIDAAART